MPNPIMMAALEYEAAGYSVIPLKPKGKVPLIPSWDEFQVTRADREQIGQWWRTWPEANIGIVTGKISGLFVIDADSPEAATGIKPLLGEMSSVGIVETGKGFHLYYSHGTVNYPNKAAIRPHIDFRGDGGYVVAPPSVHESGKHYQWSKPVNGHLRELPAEFVRLMTEPAVTGPKQRFDTAGAIAGLPHGQRDDGMFKLACKLRGADVPYEEALELCEKAAANCQPPFLEARRKVDQAYKYSPGHSQQRAPTQEAFWPQILTAQQLIDLPPDPTRWVWNECLPLRATSALIAKSYTGKSTFAASLALAVSRGIDFLGRPTQQGAVLYVYLDGPQDELKENFLKIGLCGSDPIFTYAGRKPTHVLPWCKECCIAQQVKLLIVDTAQKFFGFKEDRYEEKINAMQPMLDLVNEFNFHAMFTYHAAKNGGNSISALGSVASEANARVSLYIRKQEDGKRRVFDTDQNSGRKFEAIGLSDPKDGFLTSEGTLFEIEIRDMSMAALLAIRETPGITEIDMRNNLEARGIVLSKALKALRENNQIERTGKGRSGDPFRYFLAGDILAQADKKPAAKVIDLFQKD